MLHLRLVHGFTQAPSAWGGVVDGLERELGPTGCDVVTMEIPDALDFAATAGALAERGGRGIYAGYSMGGRLCLRAALDRPDLVRGLVLVSSTPGIDDPSARAHRLVADHRLARRIEQLGVRAFVSEWISQPLFSTLGATTAEVETRTTAHSVEELAHQARTLGQGAQEPLWERLGELAVPCLVVSGDDDARYSAIAEAVAERIRGCRLARIPGGHSLLLEQPDLLGSVMAGWMRDENQRLS